MDKELQEWIMTNEHDGFSVFGSFMRKCGMSGIEMFQGQEVYFMISVVCEGKFIWGKDRNVKYIAPDGKIIKVDNMTDLDIALDYEAELWYKNNK